MTSVAQHIRAVQWPTKDKQIFLNRMRDYLVDTQIFAQEHRQGGRQWRLLQVFALIFLPLHFSSSSQPAGSLRHTSLSAKNGIGKDREPSTRVASTHQQQTKSVRGDESHYDRVHRHRASPKRNRLPHTTARRVQNASS